jgi:hypothetical protein
MSGNGHGEHLFIAGSFFGMPLPDPLEVAAARSKEISLGIMSPILHGRCPRKGVNINISAGISGQPRRRLLPPLQTFFAVTKDQNGWEREFDI